MTTSNRRPAFTHRRAAALGDVPASDEMPATIDGSEVIAHEKVAFYPVTLERKKAARRREVSA